MLALEDAALLHGLFEYAGIALGVALYRRARRRAGQGSPLQPGSFAVIVGLLLGAAIGNKLVFLVERPDMLTHWLAGRWAWPGQSIVGGLLGGLVGVECAKRITRQPQSTGDLMAWPIAAGLVVGRVGCFVAGLHDDTFGVATTLPWGVDFGDGVRRHPTQLYEIAFVLAWTTLLWQRRARWAMVPGTLFKLFLSGYLAWRLAIDGIKPVPVAYAWAWSGIQWTCAIALAAYLPFVVRALRRIRPSPPAVAAFP